MDDINNPLVIVRSLVYNHEQYLRQCLDGFVMQKTNFKFEVQIHDDASTDNSAAIILEYAKKYPDIIKPYIEEENQYSKGSKGKWKWGPLNCKYIAICEGDDYWIDPLKLQKQVDFLESHPDYFLCCHDFKVFSEKSKEFIFDSSYQNHHKLPLTITLDNFFKGNWIQTLTIMYRNSTSSIAIPREKYKYYRDRVYHYYFLKNGKGCLLPDVMGVYRKHSGGVLSGKKAEENYYIYMSIALDIYHIENEPRALQLLRRHALGLFNYRWNHHQRKELIGDFRYLFAKAPFCTTTGLLISFIGSMLKNKLSI